MRKYSVLVFLGIIFILSLSKMAYAEKRVFSPLVEGQGVWEYETTGVYDADHRKEDNAVQEYKNTIGYGVTQHWFTELEGEFERQPYENDEGDTKISSTKFTHLEWENRYQLTEQGQYWVDSGIYFAYEVPTRSKAGSQLETKILLEKSLPNFTHTANISINKVVGGGQQNNQVDAGFSWSSKYRLSERFQPGFEYYADFNYVDSHLNYDEQSHQVGPVFYGRLAKHIEYNIGYLFGLSQGAPRGEIKWILEYEF